MNQTITPASCLTRKDMPLALIYTSRLLLTEKSSAGIDGYSLSLTAEIHTIRATMATSILKKIPGCSHSGRND